MKHVSKSHNQSSPKAKAGRDAGDEALMALAGTFHCEIGAVAERHDCYIGQQLMQDLSSKQDSTDFSE